MIILFKIKRVHNIKKIKKKQFNILVLITDAIISIYNIQLLQPYRIYCDIVMHARSVLMRALKV